jgi:serine/threonine-protein kinase HipA
MNRRAGIFFDDIFCGMLVETEDGYSFSYDRDYLHNQNAVAVSLTLPLREEAFFSPVLFAFFDGLIPEGWLLE